MPQTFVTGINDDSCDRTSIIGCTLTLFVSVSWKSTSSCGSLVSACVTILVPTVPRKSHQVVTLQ
jgi:hypothetical protein